MAKTDERVQDVEELLALGTHPEWIAQRLGLKPSSLARILYYAGRPDLASPFNSLAAASRKPPKRSTLCAGCKSEIHQAHTRYIHRKRLCKCPFCQVIMSARKKKNASL